jgi:hypothetical protein
MRDASDITFDRENLTDIYRFTNEVLNVGNYIKPAVADGIISRVVQILTE